MNPLILLSPILLVLLSLGVPQLMWIAYVPVLIAARKLTMRGLIAFSAYLTALMVFIGFSWIFTDAIGAAFIYPLIAFATYFLILFGFRTLARHGLRGLALWAALTIPLMAVLDAFQLGWFLYAHAWMIGPLHAASALFGLLIVNAALFFFQGALATRQRASLIGASVLLIALISISALPFESERDPITVAAIQPSYYESWEWRQANADTILDELFALSDDAVEQGARIIVWPESAVAIDFFLFDEPIADRLSAYAARHEIILVVGAPDVIENTSKQYNAAFVFGTDGSLLGAIRSTDPPFFNPYSVPYAESSVIEAVIDDRIVRIGGLICFEEYHRHPSKKVYAHEPDLIVILADTSDVGQRLMIDHMARIHALSARTPVVRSANTGRSVIVGSDGSVAARAADDQEAVLVASVK
jgi:apolipoprotein N-acyltransferase